MFRLGFLMLFYWFTSILLTPFYQLLLTESFDNGVSCIEVYELRKIERIEPVPEFLTNGRLKAWAIDHNIGVFQVDNTVYYYDFQNKILKKLFYTFDQSQIVLIKFSPNHDKVLFVIHYYGALKQKTGIAERVLLLTLDNGQVIKKEKRGFAETYIKKPKPGECLSGYSLTYMFKSNNVVLLRSITYALIVEKKLTFSDVQGHVDINPEINYWLDTAKNKIYVGKLIGKYNVILDELACIELIKGRYFVYDNSVKDLFTGKSVSLDSLVISSTKLMPDQNKLLLLGYRGDWVYLSIVDLQQWRVKVLPQCKFPLEGEASSYLPPAFERFLENGRKIEISYWEYSEELNDLKEKSAVCSLDE